MTMHAKKKLAAVKPKSKVKLPAQKVAPTQKVPPIRKATPASKSASTTKPAPASAKQKCSTTESNKAAIDCDPLDPWTWIRRIDLNITCYLLSFTIFIPGTTWIKIMTLMSMTLVVTFTKEWRIFVLVWTIYLFVCWVQSHTDIK